MIEKQPFGKTGHFSTRVIFGGFALCKATEYQADKTLDLLLLYMVNHIDTARDYGRSKELIGRWMRRCRADFFLATKTSSRTCQGAKENDLHSLKTFFLADILSLNYETA